jgi:hypothetical protein
MGHMDCVEQILRGEDPAFQNLKTTVMNELAMVGQRARRKYANNFRD